MARDAAPKSYVSYADYVALERESTTKHEWLDGVIYDMSGGTPSHARLAASVIGKLDRQLSGKRCCPFSADLKIRVLATGLATYPDVSVVCGSLQTDPADDLAVTNPSVIVEVLSDSSEAYDRGEKFAHYRRIPSLMEYVLVSQHEPRIEVFRRKSDGNWEFSEALEGQAARLASIECTLSVDEVYADPLSAAQPQ